MNILKINGQALEGIYVDAAISFNKPAKRVSTYSVPGRNGDLVIDEGTFDNVLITYPVFEKSTFPTKFDEIVNYLASLEGYQRIECSNDPQHYRLGRFVVPQNPTAKRLNRDGYWQLSFDCKPQRWLLSGEEDTEIDANPIDEYSGDIVSFDAVALDEITELKAAITPVQNLNGQTSPYPAGGGKNLLNPTGTTKTADGITFTVNADGTVTASGTATAQAILNYSATDFGSAITGAYLFNGNPSGASSTTYRMRIRFYSGSAWGSWSYINGTSDLSVNPSSATKVEAQIIVLSGQTVSNLVFKPMLRLATDTDPTYAPYSNICPITGWSAANVTRTGVNIWDEEWEVVSSNIWSKNFISVQPSTDYYISTAGYNIQAIWYDSTQTTISNVTKKDTVITSPSNARYMKFFVASGYGTTYNNNISINYPSTDHDYHAYAGQTYPISLGQTVYGGTLNVTTGVLTINMAMVSALWSGFRTDTSFASVERRWLALSDIGVSGAGHSISNLAGYSNSSSGDNVHFYINSQGNRFYLFLPIGTDETTEAQVCYELATPTTVQLTAAEVELLLGQNNIWADTGDVEVKVTTPTVFNNPSPFNSKPLIRVYGVGTFRVNDITVTIASHDKPYIDIDCELQECYCGSENMNEYVSFSGNDFPELQPGDNYMLLASGITKLDVTPRWWIL